MLFFDEEEARVVRRIYECYFEGYSTGGIIDKQEEKRIKPSKGKGWWSKGAIESTLTREKYTGDVAIADSGGLENQYLYEQHHKVIISKGKFKAVQLEMKLYSNVEIGEYGNARRKVSNYDRKIMVFIIPLFKKVYEIVNFRL